MACLNLRKLEHGGYDISCLEGELPSGLTLADLSSLGIVRYEPGVRGRPIPKVIPIRPSEDLDYLQALIDAMPPGYFISKVESQKIDALREARVVRFEEELKDV